MAQKRRRRSARNGHGAEGSLESLQQELTALQANVGKMISNLGGAASEGMTQAMRSASSTAEDVAEQVEEYGQEGVDTMRKTIRAQPLVACAVSVGAGALLGVFLARQ